MCRQGCASPSLIRANLNLKLGEFEFEFVRVKEFSAINILNIVIFELQPSHKQVTISLSLSSSYNGLALPYIPTIGIDWIVVEHSKSSF